MADNPAQAARAQRLRKALRDDFDVLEQEIGLRRGEDFPQARALVAAQPDPSETGRTMALLNQMKSEEELLLSERTGLSADARSMALRVGAVGMLFNVAITIVVFEMLRRQNGRRRDMQAELTETNEKLSASLQQADLTATRLAKTVENFPLGVLLVDADLRVLAFNDCFRDMLDAPEGAIKPGDELEKVWLFGLSQTELAQVDQAQLAERRRRLVENPQPHRFERIHNGRLLEARGTPVPGGGFIKIYSDITRQRAEERKLMEERNTAEEIARAKSEFLAVMSHEVRTPMNGVMGIAELLRDTRLTDEQKNYVEIILRSGEGLLTILDDILDLSKVEANKVELEAVHFHPHQVLSDLLALWGPRASAKGLKMDLRMSSEMPHNLLGDANRLRQVVSNLIGNAVKFTERGSVIIAARVVAQDKDGATLNFSVSDTGIGISEAQRERLFQPFSQADASTTRKFGGTGLGLAICLRLVEMMGGAFDVSSQEGQGSTFSFTARFAFGEEFSLPGDSLPASTTPVDQNTRFSGHVLVVEDHPVNRAVARASLTRLGLSVTEAVNGEEAIAAVEHGGIDLVFMDMHMPVMDGVDATRNIRASEHAGRLPGRLPIVAMTANVLPEAVGVCVEAGMDGFLCKPFARQQLVDILEHWLPHAQAEAPSPAQAPEAAQPAKDEAVLAEKGEVIDRKRYALLEETMGAEMEMLLDNFRATSGTLITSLQASCIKQDWQQAFRDAHTLASSAAMIGATRMSELARTLETQTRDGDTAQSAALAGRLDEEFSRVEEALAGMHTAAPLA